MKKTFLFLIICLALAGLFFFFDSIVFGSDIIIPNGNGGGTTPRCPIGTIRSTKNVDVFNACKEKFTGTCKEVCTSCRLGQCVYTWRCDCPTWMEHKCDDGSCPSSFALKRSCSSRQIGNTPVCGDIKCGEETRCKKCAPWQQCFGERERWCTSMPICRCHGPCIDKPGTVRYYDTPDYPTNYCNPEKGIDADNIFLPVKLDWDDVRGWNENPWLPECKSCDPTCPKYGCIYPRVCSLKDVSDTSYACQCVRSYEIEIYETDELNETNVKILRELRLIQPPYLKHPSRENKIILTIRCKKSDFNPQVDLSPLSDKCKIHKIHRINGKPIYNQQIENTPGVCFLKPGTVYKWRIRGCCGTYREEAAVGAVDYCGENNCGPWSEDKKFTTNWAPEPYLPLDPDWVKKDRIKNQLLDIELKWCNVFFPKKIGEEVREMEARSFKLFFYLGRQEPNEEEIIIRHPWTRNHPKILSDPRQRPLRPHFLNEKYKYFTKPPFLYRGIEYNFYVWRVAACKKFQGWGECTDFSQRWRFSLDENIELKIPELIKPLNNIEISIGLPVIFEWSLVLGAKSYIFEIRKGGELIERKIISGTTHSIDYPKLLLNTIYQWRIRACSDFEGKKCEPSWSSTYNFKTTGRAPTLITPSPNATDKPIPIRFNWENVPGAKSYWMKILGITPDEGILVENPYIIFGFPDLRQEKTYSWQVKTCARRIGKVCGEWSNPQSFTTFKLGSPINPFPKDRAIIYTYQMPKSFSWNAVDYAKYYKYIINYVSMSPEETGDCPLGEVIERIDNRPSALVSFNCLGEYQWRVQACLDKNCLEAGKESIWNFVLKAKESPEGFRAGLVPCGRDFNNPNTGWNETKPCEIKHIFLLIQIIINFILWTIVPLTLVLLTVYTGVIFYFSISTGESNPIIKVKGLWRAAGIGLGIIFLAWLTINLVLGILGFQVTIFGHWYEIPI